MRRESWCKLKIIAISSNTTNIYCRKEGKGVSAAATEMVLFKQNVKEIKGPLADFLKSHVKAAHHRTFE
jgi:succinate dehydrogenase / fumarate reductase, flavoprotein subunit